MTAANTPSPGGPTRTDLTYLRRRTRPTEQQASSAAVTTVTADAPAVQADSPGVSSVADFLSGRSVRPGRQRSTPPAPAQPPAPTTPAPTRPAAAPAPSSGSLDLGSSSAPAGPPPERLHQPPPRSEQPSTSGGSLDLGGSEDPAPSQRSSGPAGGSSLDLGGSSLDLGGVGPSVSAPAPVAHVREQIDDLRLPTITEHERRVLTAADRVVHLTRIQSAVGRLRIEPALGAGEHLDLGCVLETKGRRESIVLGTLNRQGPDPRRPMVRCGGQGAEIDLRRIHSLSRLLIVAVGGRLPGGTLVITTYGGSRMEIPLRNGPTLGAQALLTGYVVQGRLVLRAELDPFSGTLQQVCGAYGYGDLTWRDPATPLV